MESRALSAPQEHRPSFSFMVLMLGLLACVAPASIDAYLPAFDALGKEFGVAQSRIQQTLGVYVFCYAAMLLLHGTLSDALGRRVVVLIALLCHCAGSLIAAAAPDLQWLLIGRILQGLSAGAGVVVGQAIVRDCFEGSQARRMMSFLVVVFNLSPALAPVLGGYLAEHQGWRSIFLVLAALAAFTCALCAWRLPETLPPTHRRPFAARALLLGVGQLFGNLRFVAMSMTLSLLVAAQAFLIGGAPDLLMNGLGLPATAFGYLFIPLVIGAMAGALLAARMAGRWSDTFVVTVAYGVMLLGLAVYVIYVACVPFMSLAWSVIPPALFTCGLAMGAPSMTLQVLALVPSSTGSAASVFGFLQMMAFSAVSGWCVAWVYGRPLWLALAMLLCVVVSATLWCVLQRSKVACG